MILGIISDTHDQMVHINEAIDIFNKEGVSGVIHCGDFVAPFSAKLFTKLNCPLWAVYGNNDGERRGLLKTIMEFNGELFDPPHIYNILGKNIFVSHDSPTEKDLNSISQPIDYIIYGHTHHFEQSTCIGIPMINPGEACGWLTGHSTVGLLNLVSGQYQNIKLKKSR